MNDIDVNYIKKWKPVVENFFKIRNTFLINHICNYCEYYSLNGLSEENSLSLVGKLNELNSKINSSKRVEIIKTVFNTHTGEKEYELSNGNYARAELAYYELSLDELICLFDIDYIKFYDIKEYRDKRIDNII